MLQLKRMVCGGYSASLTQAEEVLHRRGLALERTENSFLALLANELHVRSGFKMKLMLNQAFAFRSSTNL